MLLVIRHEMGLNDLPAESYKKKKLELNCEQLYWFTCYIIVDLIEMVIQVNMLKH